ncbi:MAG TPA: hypothetical protein VNJ04_07655 [Gemmatimonadaceae bacterium]|nr:hypothetical protein [Gemmatimonadaceae bacterium]
MTPALRKLALTTHVILSVGWLGAVVAYLALAIVGLTSARAEMVRAAYLSMEAIGWYVIVPFSLAALAVGLLVSLGTPWGLFRYWWVLAKFLLTTGATVILLRHMPAVTRMSGMAAGADFSAADLRAMRMQLVVHAAGGLLVLLAATVLSVFKPWGMTPYGRRRQIEGRVVPSVTMPARPALQALPRVGPPRGRHGGRTWSGSTPSACSCCYLSCTLPAGACGAISRVKHLPRSPALAAAYQ